MVQEVSKHGFLALFGRWTIRSARNFPTQSRNHGIPLAHTSAQAPSKGREQEKVSLCSERSARGETGEESREATHGRRRAPKQPAGAVSHEREKPARQSLNEESASPEARTAWRERPECSTSENSDAARHLSARPGRAKCLDENHRRERADPKWPNDRTRRSKAETSQSALSRRAMDQRDPQSRWAAPDSFVRGACRAFTSVFLLRS